MFDGSHGRFKFFLAETFVGRSQVLNQKAEWNLFGDLESPLEKLAETFEKLEAA